MELELELEFYRAARRDDAMGPWIYPSFTVALVDL